MNFSDPNGHQFDVGEDGNVNWACSGCDTEISGQIGRAALNFGLDVAPVTGEIRGAIDAYNDPSWINIAGAIPGVGRLVKPFKAAKAIKATSQVDPSWQSKIKGTAQKTGEDSWHADSSYEKAVKYAKDPNVESVHLNRSLDAIMGTKKVYNTRPDITVVYKDGTRVRICECVSPSQTRLKMERKNRENEKKLSQNGKRPSSEVTVRGDKSDSTGGRANGSAPGTGNWKGAPK